MSIRLMSQIWDNEDPELTGSRLVILLCLADHANDTGDCWPSIERLAKRARLSKVSTMTHLQELEAIGYITVERRLGAHNIYHVNAAPTTPRAERLPKAGNVANLKTSQDSATGKVDLTSQDSATPTSQATLTTTSQVDLTTPVKVTQHEPSVNHHLNHQKNQGETPPPLRTDPPATEGRRLSEKLATLNAKLSPALRMPLANVLLDITGKRALADAGDDGLLYGAHEAAQRLYLMGYKTDADLLAIEEAWLSDWRGKSGGGTFKQFEEFASERKTRRNGHSATPPPTGKATIRVKFDDGQVVDQEITTHG